MKKAYGFPTNSFGKSDIAGVVISEDGEYLGHWVSSDLQWLKKDLSNHANGYDYVFYEKLPDDIASELERKAKERAGVK